MAKKAEIGAKIVIDGEREFRESVKNINSAQKELNSEMKLSSATFKEQQNSMDALKSKYDILSRQVDVQREKVALYSKHLDEAREAQQKSATKTQEYAEKLEDARKEMEKMASSSDDNAEAMKEQEELIESLTLKHKASEEEYDRITRSVESFQTGLNLANAQLVTYESDLEKTGRYLDEAKNSSDGLATSIDEMGKEMNTTSDDALKFGDVMKANLASELVMAGLSKMVELVSQAGEGLYDLATSSAYYADSINTLSTQTGIATDTLQALKYSEELLDVSVSTVTQSMTKNIRSMKQAQEGSDNYAEAYKALGVQFMDTNGDLRDNEEVFWELIDALGKVTNETERDAYAMQLFGRNAQQLNPLIKAGSEGFMSLKKEAEDLGYILEQDTLDSLNGTSDALERVSKMGDSLKNKIGATLGNTVTQSAEKIYEVISKNEDKIMGIAERVIPALADGLITVVENVDKIIPLVAGMTSGFVAFKAMSVAVSIYNGLLSVFKSRTQEATIAQEGMNVAGNANPYIAMASAILGVITALSTFFDLNESFELNDSVGEQVKEWIDTRKAIEDASRAREEDRQAIEANYAQSRILAKELENLTNKTTLTADEQNRLAQIVAELNEAMPDLNLEIDSQTGKLNKNTEAIYAQIEALKDYYLYQAAKEDLAEISKNLYDAQKQESQMQNQLNEAQNRYVQIRQALLDNSRLTQHSKITIDGITKEKMEWEDLAFSISKGFDGMGNAIENNRRQQQELQEEFENTSEIISNYSDATDIASASLEHMDDVAVAVGNRYYTVSTETAENLERLKVAYAEAYESAEESISKQVGLFEELSATSDKSISEMGKTFEQQASVISQYSEDMTRAMELVESGMLDEGLLGAIKELGLDGAGYLHELVTSAETDSDAFAQTMQDYGNLAKAKEELARNLADIETGYSDAYEKIKEENRKRLEDEQTTSDSVVRLYKGTNHGINKTLAEEKPDAKKGGEEIGNSTLQGLSEALGIESGISLMSEELGKAFGDGFVSGLDEKLSDVRKKAEEIAKIALKATAEAQDSHSPSKEAIKLGKNYGDGYNIGLESSIAEAQDIVRNTIPTASNMGLSAESRLNSSTANNISNLVRTLNQMAGTDKQIVVNVNAEVSGRQLFDVVVEENNKQVMATGRTPIKI